MTISTQRAKFPSANPSPDSERATHKGKFEMTLPKTTRWHLWGALCGLVVFCCGTLSAAEANRPVKVFILAGDENCLEQGVVEGRTAGALETAVAEKKERCGFLKNVDGGWGKRDDVVVYDGQQIYNNTKAIGSFLGVSSDPKDPRHGVGPDLMFGRILGEHFTEPVLIYRFATRGKRSLGNDYLPPSSGANTDLTGGWDVIHFNWGAWDIAYRNPKANTFGHLDKVDGKITTPIDVYESNLNKLVERLKKTDAILIWGSITPVHEGCLGRFKEDPPRYNAVAEKIMKQNGVIIDDLYAESIRLGYPKAPDVHSVGRLAPKVIETIRSALASRKKNTKALPRVLMIGDSITGSYIKEVQKTFDGEAQVFMIPANGEHTGTGLAKIEAWLDLKQYLQNGQEYLGLVDGVRFALAEFERVYPGYKKQGTELAGMVWFQGIADSQSPAQTAAYEKNLANLIRDVRRDLKAPALPVVVTAVGFGNGKVHDAQMAVGDPAKYPEFAGNVKSIDTRPFVRPSNGKPDFYFGNAETFLEIGEAMGQAMLELTKQKK